MLVAVGLWVALDHIEAVPDIVLGIGLTLVAVIILAFVVLRFIDFLRLRSNNSPSGAATIGANVEHPKDLD